MSQKFSNLFREIQCVGELRLQNKEILSEMFIEILVSYRQGAELMPLSSSVQSGGEQMVATMIYLFSLQELTPHAPFRVSLSQNPEFRPCTFLKFQVSECRFVLSTTDCRRNESRGRSAQRAGTDVHDDP